jgi:hypothetical protein
MATLNRVLPAKLSQWRVSVTWDAPGKGGVDVFLLDCTGKAGCSVAAVRHMTRSGATLVVEQPKEGQWRIVLRARDADSHPVSYRVREAWLTPSAAANRDKEASHASGACWRVEVPAKTGEAQYAAFVIAGKPFRILDDSGKELKEYHFAWKAIGVPVYDASNADMRIAMTPLTAGAP